MVYVFSTDTLPPRGKVASQGGKEKIGQQRLLVAENFWFFYKILIFGSSGVQIFQMIILTYRRDDLIPEDPWLQVI